MSKFFKFKAEVVPGKCPTCEEHTLLVGLTKEYYRCMTCGADLEQHVNGKISYIPAMHHEYKIILPQPKPKPETQSKVVI
jgi:ribosomal protein S27E